MRAIRKRTLAIVSAGVYVGVTLALAPVAAGIDLLRAAHGARETLGLLAEATADATLEHFENYAEQVLGLTQQEATDA